MITASHNPAQYNGYKVYWKDGAQITAPRDREIISKVNSVADEGKTMAGEQAKASILIVSQPARFVSDSLLQRVNMCLLTQILKNLLSVS